MRKTIQHLQNVAATALLLLGGSTGTQAATWMAASDSLPTTEEYTLYSCDFDEGYAPFTPGWAWAPNYIEAKNGYCEFYYNQAALDADNRRERRGCELTCDFSTQSQGWYGYKLYLPEGKMPKDLTGTIITQFFQSGSRNSWAGHLDIDGQQLQLQYRHALVDPQVRNVGKLAWDSWQNIVVYFRVGINGKGCIKVWLGEGELSEESPALVCEGINFGFANHWIDDTHQDPTPYESNGKEYTDHLGGKWGFYVSQGGDRTLCLANLRVLSGNPAEAFSLVDPSGIANPAYQPSVNLINADCSSLVGWSDEAGVWTVDEGQNMGGDKQKYFQIWTGGKAPAGTLRQSLQLAAGCYRLSVDGIAVSDGNKAAIADGSALLFATSGGVTTEVPFCGVKKSPQRVSLEFEVGDEGEATVGIRVKQNSAANWVAVDNFALTPIETHSGIVSTTTFDEPGDGRIFNLLGQPVGAGYKGVAVKNGKKVLLK